MELIDNSEILHTFDQMYSKEYQKSEEPRNFFDFILGPWAWSNGKNKKKV